MGNILREYYVGDTNQINCKKGKDCWF